MYLESFHTGTLKRSVGVGTVSVLGVAVRESLLTLVNIETLAPITRVPVLVAHTPEVQVFVVAVGIRVTVREPSRTLVEFYSTINIIQARRRRAHKENVAGTESVLNAGFDIAIFR